MTRFTHHYFSSHEKRNGIDVMGGELKGVNSGGCGCVTTVGRGGGLKHKLETWHVLKVQVLGAPAQAWESVPGCLGLSSTFTMCPSNNVRGH
jgi:hypothetical protein